MPMGRLAITTGTFTAGMLKKAGYAESVICVAPRLIRGKFASEVNTDTFFAACVQSDTDFDTNWLAWTSRATAKKIDSRKIGFIEFSKNFDLVELWVEPDTNSQIVMVMILDYVSKFQHVIDKFSIFQVNSISMLGKADLSSLEDIVIIIKPSSLVPMARKAWAAFRYTTPEKWFALLDQDMRDFSYLRRAVISQLQELPDITTAIGASGSYILKKIYDGESSVKSLFEQYLNTSRVPTMNYWELGAELERLCYCSVPAIKGLRDLHFKLDVLNNVNYVSEIHNTKMSVTDLGRRLVEQKDDFSNHNTIDYQWGGTNIKNDQLWRWDNVNTGLVHPK
jgi:hypothetical protein